MTKSTPQQSMEIESKIKYLFDAVFEPREEFNLLTKNSQDILLGRIQDAIVEGFEAFQKDILKREQEAYEKGKADGRNEYYFDSPEYLVKEAHSLACTLAQRWNQGNYNNSMKSFREEQTRLSNELVSVTKKIKNLTQPEKGQK